MTCTSSACKNPPASPRLIATTRDHADPSRFRACSPSPPFVDGFLCSRRLSYHAHHAHHPGLPGLFGLPGLPGLSGHPHAATLAPLECKSKARPCIPYAWHILEQWPAPARHLERREGTRQTNWTCRIEYRLPPQSMSALSDSSGRVPTGWVLVAQLWILSPCHLGILTPFAISHPRNRGPGLGFIKHSMAPNRRSQLCHLVRPGARRLCTCRPNTNRTQSERESNRDTILQVVAPLTNPDETRRAHHSRFGAGLDTILWMAWPIVSLLGLHSPKSELGGRLTCLRSYAWSRAAGLSWAVYHFISCFNITGWYCIQLFSLQCPAILLLSLGLRPLRSSSPLFVSLCAFRRHASKHAIQSTSLPRGLDLTASGLQAARPAAFQSSAEDVLFSKKVDFPQAIPFTVVVKPA